MKTNISLLVFVFMINICACRFSDTTIEGREMFHYTQANPITSLDPAFARNQANIWADVLLYDCLVRLDDSLNVQPALASRWEIIDSNKTYIFHLRKNVFFQENKCFPQPKRRLTAHDVVYSFRRLVSPHTGSPGAWIFKDKIQNTETAFSAPNDSIFILRLNKPFPPIFGLLSNPYTSILPKEALDYYGKDFRANPVGTGAFYLVKWKENKTMILAKNPNYFEKGLPYLDGVRINFTNDKTTAFIDFEQGKIDMMTGLTAGFADRLLSKEGELHEEWQQKISFHRSPYLNMEYLGILQKNNTNNALKNKKVRQALNYAIDKKEMLRTFRNSVGKPATAGFVPIGLPSYTTKLIGYDYAPEKAAKLLQEAGYPSGKGIPTILLTTNSEYADLCGYIVKEWRDLGIDARIDIMESSVLRTQRDEGKLSVFRASWIADYPDAENFLALFYGKNTSPPNFTQFKNALFDELYEKAMRTTVTEKRYDYYQKMDSIVIEEAPVIFLFYDETARFSKKNIEGFSNNALNILSLTKVKYKTFN